MSCNSPRRLAALALACACAATATLILPGSANAAVSCAFSAAVGNAAVDVDASSDVVSLQLNGNNIEVVDGFPGDPTLVACSPDTPTLTNTSAIQMNDIPGVHDTTFLIELGAGPFEPGADIVGEGTGVREIEIAIDGGGNTGDGDGISITGSTGDENWRFGALTGGASGANLNAPETGTPDGDDIRLTGIESVQGFSDPVLALTGGSDSVTANGTTGEFTGPLSMTTQFSGGAEDDVLTGGTGQAFLFGEEDDDTVTGGPLNDHLRVAFGDDVAAGGGGTDECSYLNQLDDLHVDLRVTTQQSVGGGELDTLSGCEDSRAETATMC